MHILLTGGAGYIGSHTSLALIERGHSVTVVDNLVTGSIDLVPKEESEVFKQEQMDAEMGGNAKRIEMLSGVSGKKKRGSIARDLAIKEDEYERAVNRARKNPSKANEEKPKKSFEGFKF